MFSQQGKVRWPVDFTEYNEAGEVVTRRVLCTFVPLTRTEIRARDESAVIKAAIELRERASAGAQVDEIEGLVAKVVEVEASNAQLLAERLVDWKALGENAIALPPCTDEAKREAFESVPVFNALFNALFVASRSAPAKN